MKPQLKKLKNGSELLLVQDDSFQTVTILVLVGTGSNYEAPSENGLSHFLEHMCFKGTEKYPSARVISETIESLGAVSNAYTSNEYTAYFIKGNPKHTPIYIDVLSDIYLNSVFPVQEIEKEKGVIIEEIRMYDEMHQYKVVMELMTLMFPDQPAGRSILGTPQTVQSFSQKDFNNYKNKFYHAENTVIAVCGPKDEKVKSMIERAFASIENKKTVSKKPVRVQAKSFKSKIISRKIDQSYLAIGFHSVPFGHVDGEAVKLLATILGRGMSSRLFMLLREELGVAYSVQASQDSYQDHGVFEIIAGIDKGRVNEVLALIAKEIKLIATKGVTEGELRKAKEYTYGMFRLGLETTDDLANFYGAQRVLKRPLATPKEIIKRYEQVSINDIRRVAKKIFLAKKANIAIIGPHDEKDIDTSALAGL